MCNSEIITWICKSPCVLHSSISITSYSCRNSSSNCTISRFIISIRKVDGIREWLTTIDRNIWRQTCKHWVTRRRNYYILRVRNNSITIINKSPSISYVPSTSIIRTRLNRCYCSVDRTGTRLVISII